MSNILIKLKGRLDPETILVGIGLLLILLIMFFLHFRDIADVTIAFPDAGRLLMDGVFIHDFLKDFPISRIYQYTTEYYAQYPALSIGYRPPFYPLIEAIFNTLFGIEIWSSRLAILPFALLGLGCWFDLLRRNYDTSIAISSILLLVSSPFVSTWGWYTLTELPVLYMVMASAYFFFRYYQNDKPVYLYTFALLFCISVWTKQTAAFQVIWYALFMLFNGVLPTYLKRKEVWISIVTMILLITPLIVITLWLGKANLAQSIGSSGSSFADFSRMSWANLSWVVKVLLAIQITPPVTALSLVGAAVAIYKRDVKLVFFALLIASVYIFFTYILAKSARYTIFWIPAFTLLAVLPLYYFKNSKVFCRFSWVIICLVTIFQIYKTYEKPILRASGYKEAAEFVLKNCLDSPTVLFDGYNNGYFTYFMRALDPKKSMYVLRGDKLLSSSSIYSNSKYDLELHASTKQDITKLIDKFAFSCLVVESREPFGLEIHRIFRDHLATGPFQLMHEIKVNSNRPALKNQTLKIYRYLDLKPPTADYLIIKLPIVGQELKIPYRKLLKN